MDLPSFPTDSIYKFQAIAGVVLMLAAAVLPRQYADSYRQKAREVGIAADKLEIEVKHFKDERARQTMRLDHLGLSLKALNESIPTLSPQSKHDRDVAELKMRRIDKEQEEIEAAQKEIDAASYQEDLKLAELKGAFRESKDLRGDADEAIKESKFMLALGTFLEVIGFFCWIWYIQRYQDYILKQKALALRDTNQAGQRSRPRQTGGRFSES